MGKCCALDDKTTGGRKSDTVWWLEFKVTTSLKIWFLPTWWNGRHKRLKISGLNRPCRFESGRGYQVLLILPLDVYQKPRTLFAPRFVGSAAMNILDANIVGGAIKLNGVSIEAASVPEGPIKFGIQPEYLVQNETGPLQANIHMSEPLGANTLLHGRLAGMDNVAITVSLQGVHHVEDKSKAINFSVDPENIHLFDSDIGQRRTN